MSDKEAIEEFISKHHVLVLATLNDEHGVETCSLFYAYDASQHCFVFASDPATHHVQNAMANPSVAAAIHLETQEVGKIQGVQIEGSFIQTPSASQKRLYFKRFPYALAMKPKLWGVRVKRFKYTDNRLGFGTKLIYEPETSL